MKLMDKKRIMSSQVSLRWFQTVGVLASLVPISALAQSLRYMDNAGNIRFAESLKEVPRQYREQIVPPTPTPVLDRRALQEKKRLEMEAVRQRQIAQRRKKLEELQRVNENRRQQDREHRRLKEQEQAGGFVKGVF